MGDDVASGAALVWAQDLHGAGLHGDDALALTRRIGGKALGLARLDAAGLPVPAWACITTDLGEDDAALHDVVAVLLSRDWSGPLAVRSSAVDEDGSGASFAGQFDTVLGVEPTADALERAIRQCRASATGERAQRYRDHHGMEAAASTMAVVVQELVEPAAAGVALTADPATGATDMVVVSAVAGRGDALVDGSADADTYRLLLADGSVQAHPAAHHRVLDDPQVRSVADLARRAGAALGGVPTDVEWAIADDGTVWLLQARPLVPAAPGPSYDYWDHTNFEEVFGGALTPLTWSAVEDQCAIMFATWARVVSCGRDRGDEVLTRTMLRQVDGRAYIGLSRWMTMADSCVPDTPANQAMREHLNIVPEALGLDRQPAPAETGDPNLALLVRDASDRGPAGTERLAAALAAHIAEWEPQLGTPAVAGAYDAFLDHVREHWEAMAWGDVCAAVSGNELGALAAALGAPAGAWESAIRVHTAAASAAHLLRAIGAATGADRERLRDEFVATYGFQLVDGLQLESGTYADDPTLVDAAAAAAARTPEIDDTSQTDARATLAALATGAGDAAALDAAVARASRDLEVRERQRTERARAFSWLRRVALALGQRLAASGVLDDPADVHMATFAELSTWCATGQAARDEARGIVALRRADHLRALHEPPPPPLLVSVDGGALQPAYDEPPPDGTAFQGTGCAPGRVAAPALVAHSAADIAACSGEVLVCERITPDQAMLLPGCAALVVERGSPLAHSVLVARELGIPTVVGVPGLLAAIDALGACVVHVDGAAGTVHLSPA